VPLLPLVVEVGDIAENEAGEGVAADAPVDAEREFGASVHRDEEHPEVYQTGTQKYACSSSDWRR